MSLVLKTTFFYSELHLATVHAMDTAPFACDF
jgi:hypothetical protein